ncbi:DUF4267 domain-containing protein [Pseudoalteromonas sp. MMG005]|uniref:DUF4267 domain-containing protein n=1 Tax=Pseudoalteromonas sp. MMG005 TaxID=2822682 RepID=UPI0032B4ED9C
MVKSKIEVIAIILVSLMALLQGFYGIFSYLEPSGFATVRGTELFSYLDADWVIIYGSRTIFITLVLGLLIIKKQYSILMWCAIFGVVMPVTDGVLAYQADAPLKVIYKHVATVLYLLVTFYVLKLMTSRCSAK